LRKKIGIILLSLFVSITNILAQRIELPRTEKGRKEVLIDHTGFCVSYNQQWLIPNWVAWELIKDETSGTVARQSQFKEDPKVRGRQATTYDYSRSGYDRGHMAPAGDMKWSQDAMIECFYLTNICPQNHEINDGQWKKLEERCRGWAKFHGKVWICCGPIMGKSAKTIGQSKVSVPSGFFKVVCAERKGRYEAVGFIFPNGPAVGDIWQYACPVDEVEEIVGHDFFFNLPDEIEIVMEASWNQKFWKSN